MTPWYKMSLVVTLLLASTPRADARSAAPATQPVQGAPLAGLPTPATLGRWLEGKEVVEVLFAGPRPRMDPAELRKAIGAGVPDDDRDFRLSAAEGGSTTGALVRVCMKVSPENRRRLLAVQEELAPRGYHLDPRFASVWSYPRGEEGCQAVGLAPQIVAAFQAAVTGAVPGIGSRLSEKRREGCLEEVGYEIPNTDVRGWLRIYEVTAMKGWHWNHPEGYDQRFHLPHLGLMVTTSYRPGRAVPRNQPESPEHEAIRAAVAKAVEPLLKLESEAADREVAGGAPNARPAEPVVTATAAGEEGVLSP